MQTLEPPDSHFLSAAEGWTELGNLAEAKSELKQISDSNQDHPLVLELKWAIHAQEKDWMAALEAARQLLAIAPEECFGWLHQAYALRRTPAGGLQAAWDALLPALERFPKVPTVPYNLACYACQMQRMDEARLLLRRAMEVADKEQIKKMALRDSDLEPLWPEIREY
jgi:tetratricopeptide (TPR) repeat protein